jgi:hypothetical protein
MQTRKKEKKKNAQRFTWFEVVPTSMGERLFPLYHICEA